MKGINDYKAVYLNSIELKIGDKLSEFSGIEYRQTSSISITLNFMIIYISPFCI